MLIKYIKNVYRYVKIGNEGEEKRERVSYYQFTDDAVEYFMPDIYNELKNTKVDNSSKTKRMEEVVEDAIETMGIDFSDETAEMESTKKKYEEYQKRKKTLFKGSA